MIDIPEMVSVLLICVVIGCGSVLDHSANSRIVSPFAWDKLRRTIRLLGQLALDDH